MKGTGLAIVEIEKRRVGLEKLPHSEIQTPAGRDADAERPGRAVQGIITQSRISSGGQQQLDRPPRSTKVRPVQWSCPEVCPERKIRILAEQIASDVGLCVAAGN